MTLMLQKQTGRNHKLRPVCVLTLFVIYPTALPHESFRLIPLQTI